MLSMTARDGRADRPGNASDVMATCTWLGRVTELGTCALCAAMARMEVDHCPLRSTSAKNRAGFVSMDARIRT